MEWDCNNKDAQYFKDFSEKCLLLEILLYTIELTFFYPLWMQRGRKLSNGSRKDAVELPVQAFKRK